MPTENKPKRSDYQKELRQRVQRFLNEEVTIQCLNCGGELDTGVADEIFSLVREVALDSYKNGVAVGKRAKRSTQSYPSSALQNGKLKPVRKSN